MMGVAKANRQQAQKTAKRASRGGRRRLLGSGSAMAAAIAIASLFSAPAAAQSASPVARQNIVQPVIQQRVPNVMRAVTPGSPVIGAASRSSAPPAANNNQRIPTPIASRYYIAAQGLSLSAPTVPAPPSLPLPIVQPNVPVTPPPSGAGPATPTAPPAGNAGPSLGSIRNAVTSTDFDAARDGINVRARAQFDSNQVDFRPDASGDMVELLTSNAIINWDTFVTGTDGNAVTFLGTGSQLGFTSSLSDYTVLNRVFTGTLDSAIRIDGSVTSTVNGGAAIGGNVWFYSPGGVIIGSTGAFNVGGLVLTSSQMDSIGAGGTQMSFGGVADPSSSVVIERGANITTNNYLAVVAPRVEQHGTVSSTGSVAYVGAEQAQLTISNGLFDISVDVGTGDANGVVHTGTTGGPAASGDPRAISMVAVPKNSAMTMLVGGDIGYQAAGGVTVDEDGKIILTAGKGGSVNVTDARLTGNAEINAGDAVRFGASVGGVTSASGDVDITAGSNGSNGGVIEIASAGSVDVAGNLSLDVSGNGDRDTNLGRGQVDISASGAGASINVAGDLNIDASTDGIITEANGATVGLSVENTGSTGGIRVGGELVIDTSAASGSDFITTEAGGVAIDVENGALSFASLTLDAQASATGSALGQTGAGRDYRGGAFSLRVGENGSIDGGAVNIDNSAAGVDGQGGVGRGGSVDLALDGGNLSLGDVALKSTGIGGDAPDLSSVVELNNEPIGGFGTQTTAAATGFPSAGDGGDGFGGAMTFTVDGGDATLENLDVESIGIGSDGADGSGEVSTNGGNAGDGFGGEASFNALAGTLNVVGIITVAATGNTVSDQGVGGSGDGSDGGDGGSGIGGTATFTMDGSATISASAIFVDATGFGGAGGGSTERVIISPAGIDPANDAGNGGDGVGGIAVFTNTSGNLSFSTLAVIADGFGGTGGDAQDGGGAASLGGAGGNGVAGSATINLNQDDLGGASYFSLARAGGGDGGEGDIGGTGGNATGGLATINVNNAALDADIVVIESLVIGGDGGASNAVATTGGLGGNATGGTSALVVDGLAASFSTATQTDLLSTASAGAGGAGGSDMVTAGAGGTGGTGGDATGGTVSVDARNGASVDLLIDDLVSVAGAGGSGGTGGNSASAVGGDGGAAGASTGGTITLTVASGSSLDLSGLSGTLTLDASALGAVGGSVGSGTDSASPVSGTNGASSGGTVSLVSDGASSNLSIGGNLVIDASAVGNQDLRVDAVGADSTGGNVQISAQNNGGFSVSGGLWIDASALAAIGEASAGTATGGQVDLLMSGAGAAFELLGEFPTSSGFPIGPSQNSLYVNASAYEPQSGVPLLMTAVGGDTTGGAISIDFTGGTSTIVSRTELVADSGATNPQSGSGAGPGVFVNAAIATGGTISIDLADSTHNWGRFDGAINTFGFGGSSISGNIDVTLDNATLDLGAERFSLFTYTAGEVVVVDPLAIDLQILNGSNVTVSSIDLFADTGHGVSSNTIHTGDISVLVDNSTVTASGPGFRLGNEAQAFRFPSVVTNTSNADAVGGSLLFVAQNGSVINAQVYMESYALADSGPNGGSATSGAMTYLLDGSTQNGDIVFYSFSEGQGASDVAGSGGSTNGGEMNISITGRSVFIGAVDLETSLYTYYNTDALGGIGSVTGGAINVAVSDSDATFFDINVVTSDGADPAAPGFVGSDVTSSDFSLAVINSTVGISDLNVDVSAIGGAGGDGTSAAGTAGGTGQAGNITITSDAASTLNIDDSILTASGTGGSGGSGPFGFNGGDGGAGVGGAISLDIENDPGLETITMTANGTGGTGGAGGDEAAGGSGGNGQGGTAEFRIAGSGVLLSDLGSAVLSAQGFGGSGGTGGQGGSTSDGGTGGRGGNGTSGTVAFGLASSDDSASFDLNPFLISLNVDAMGGTGGTGGANFFGGTAGDGGVGGEAVGGEHIIEAGSGATITLLQVSATPFDFAANGFGGAGGTGGALDLTNGGIQGTGGDGGTGTGGSPILRALGGTISSGDVDIYATGTGGDGGIGGDDGGSISGPSGNGGAGIGGTPILETFDGSPGIITLGDVTIDASGLAGGGTVTGGTAGGQIVITDGSADPAGLISMDSLTVTVDPSTFTPGSPSLTISSDSGPITVANDFDATVSGDIVFDFDGDGQMVVGGTTHLVANDSIIVTHTNNAAGTISLDTTDDLFASAQGDFNSQDGSILSGNEFFIEAGGNVSAADLRAVPFLVIGAGGSVMLQDATVTGPQGVSNFGGIIIDAGLDPFAPSVTSYDNAANAVITGTVDSYSDITIRAGGNAVFQTGSSTVASDRLTVLTGDDIIVESGAILISARNPTFALDTLNPFNGTAALTLGAGGLTNLLSVPLTPIASLIVDGTLNANGSAIIATANAIDGLGGTFIGSSIALDINDAPPSGAVQSDDNGLLSANCLEGNICVGDIQGDNLIIVGESSNNGVIQLIVEQGTVNAREIRITTREDLVMGTDGIATALAASDRFEVRSTQGDIDLREAAISSQNVIIDAAGSLLGSASLSSGQDIGITVGQDVFAASIDAGRELTAAADINDGLEGFFSVPGSLVVGSLSVGAGDVDYTAGDDIVIDSITVPGTNVSLVAGGLVGLGFTGSADGVDILASDVSIGAISNAGSVNVDADGNVDFDQIEASNDITIGAGGAVNGGDLISDGSIILDASGSITVDHAEAGIDLIATAGGNFTTGLNSIITGGDIIISTGGIADLGNSTAGGLIDVLATQIDFANLDAGSSVTLETVIGTIGSRNIVGGTIHAVTDVTVDGGSLAIDQIDAGGSIDLTSLGNRGIQTGALTAGSNITIFAGLNGFSGTTLDAGGILDIFSTRNVSFIDSSSNFGTNIQTANSGDVIADSISSGSSVIDISADGFVDVLSISSQGLVLLTAQDGIVISTLSADEARIDSSNGDVAITQDIIVSDIVDVSGLSIYLRAIGDLEVSAEATAGDVDIVAGGALNVRGASATGDIDLASTGGSTTANEVFISAGSLPPGTQGTQQITTSGGNITITAAADVIVNSFIDAANLLTIEAGNLLDLQATTSGAEIEVLAADINIGTDGTLGRSDRTDNIYIASEGDIYLGGEGGQSSGFELDDGEFDRVYGAGDITINAILLGTGSGNITVDNLNVLVNDEPVSPSENEGNIAQNGTLTLDAGGSVNVIGDLTIFDSTPDTNLVIFASDQITVDVNNGNLRVDEFIGVEDDDNIISGNIELFATSIIAISSSAESDIAGASVEDIDLRLGQNDGDIRDEGYFQATNLTFNVNESLLIQNSGDGSDLDDRRGFTADNVTINEIDATSPIVVVINGVVEGETGVDALNLVNINTDLDLASTINGCLIIDPATCVVIAPEPEGPEGPEGPFGEESHGPIENPLQDLLEEEIEEESEVGQAVTHMIMEFREDPQNEPDPLINEAVTGAGNEDLWVDPAG